MKAAAKLRSDSENLIEVQQAVIEVLEPVLCFWTNGKDGQMNHQAKYNLEQAIRALGASLVHVLKLATTEKLPENLEAEPKPTKTQSLKVAVGSRPTSSEVSTDTMQDAHTMVNPRV